MSEYSPTADEIEEFDSRLIVARLEEEKVDPLTIYGKNVAWCAQDGSQTFFMECTLFECLYHGTRGPGKTDALLMDYAQYVNKGFGEAWRGIIFRQTYPQLADIQAKSEKWFRQIFPNAKFNKSKMTWTFPGGEQLLFRHIARPEDYWNYHGHEYPFMGFEELTNWADARCYTSMMSCCRSSNRSVPRMVRATTNPYGIGHNWVMDRFKLHGQWWKHVIQLEPKDIDGNVERSRCAIHGHIDENHILLAADPNYKQTIRSAAGNEGMADAWLHGSWDIIAGGMFDDVFNKKIHIVPRFIIPPSWRMDRSFDWGSTAPFSVGWWAHSDGSDFQHANGQWQSSVRGDLFRVAEWYGWNGEPNKGVKMLATEISEGILEREINMGYRTGKTFRIKPGPADSSIYDTENGVCYATDMANYVRVKGERMRGVQWTRANKKGGSRKTGWELMRTRFKDAIPNEHGMRERPGLFVFDNCDQFIRTVPTLPRDEKNLDDVDTDAEDHIGDETRYEVLSTMTVTKAGRTTGMF